MSRRAGFQLALGLLLVSAGAKEARADRVDWFSGSYEEALASASQKKQLLLIDFFTTWCGPCHELDERFFLRDEFSKLAHGGFVSLKIDAEDGAGVALAKRFHVVGYPTLMVIDTSGAEVDRVMGGLGDSPSAVAELISQLKAIREQTGALPQLEKKLAAQPKDAALADEVAKRHAYRGDARAVTELRAIGTPSSLLTLGKYYYLRGAHDYVNAEKALLEVIARAPKSQEAAQVPYNLAIVYHETGRDPLARKTLDAWLAEGSKETDRYNTYAWFCFKNNFDRARGVEVALLGLAVAPNAHELWDTLAELRWSMGQRDEAKKAAEHALSLKPTDTYYAAQLKRFSTLPGGEKK